MSRAQARLWRVLARSRRLAGDLDGYRRAARTAAIIERRPWAVDRRAHAHTLPAPQHRVTA